MCIQHYRLYLFFRTSSVLFLALFCASVTRAAAYDELAAWARKDSDDYAQFVKSISKARNAHEVTAAMRENVRRQRKTITSLLQFVRAHPELRDAAQLGLDKDGQIIWHQRHPDRIKLPAEITAIKQQMTNSLDAADATGGKAMVNVLRKYNTDPEVLSASKELHQMWSEHRRKLLEILQ